MTAPQPKRSTGHTYTFEGKNYPSVTTILHATEDGGGLDNWRKAFIHTDFKTADEYTRYTSIRGTLVHFNILNKIANTILDPSHLPPLSEWWDRREQLIQDVDIAKKLWEETPITIRTPIVVETPYYHPDLGYAGTPDMMGRVTYSTSYTTPIDNVITIVELKTSRGVRENHRIQLGGYAQMVNRWNPGFIRAGMIVYLHPSFKRALICVLPENELKIEIEIFNERLEAFWRIPGMKQEYGVV